MSKTLLSLALTLGLATGAAAPALAKNPMVGGAPMYASKTIVENAVNSKDHTTLVAAVKAAGLVDTLSGPGPFTVFAPTIPRARATGRISRSARTSMSATTSRSPRGSRA